MEDIKTCTRCNTPIDGSPVTVTRCVPCEETVAAAAAWLAEQDPIAVAATEAAEAMRYHAYSCVTCFEHGSGFCPSTDGHEADEAEAAWRDQENAAEYAAFIGPRLPLLSHPWWDDKPMPF
jgi:hypothetical protein